jgi:hypothetical protein
MSRKKKVPRYRRHRTWYALAFELLLVLPLDKLVFQAFVAEFSVADQWLAAEKGNENPSANVTNLASSEIPHRKRAA